jgi:acetyl esterase/lipase
MQLASRLGGPVLLIDYPLVPMGSWRDQVNATMQALRWLAAWDGRIAGEVCRPGSCKANSAPPAERSPTLAQLLRWKAGTSSRASGNSSFPHLVLGGDSAGGQIILSTLAALASPKFATPGSLSLVTAGFSLAPSLDYVLDLSPTLVTGRFALDPSRGVAVGDIVEGRASVTDYWFSSFWVKQAILKGRSSSAAKQERRDFEVVAPLWAQQEVLQQMPPLILEVRGEGAAG